MSPTLLTLPPEILLQIYEDVLCFDGVEVELQWVDLIALRSERHGRPGLASCGPCKSMSIDPTTSTTLPATHTTRQQRRPIRVRLDALSSMRRRSGYEDSSRQCHCTVAQAFQPLSSVLSLLLTCRQVYSAAHLVFWSRNAFIVDNKMGLHYLTQCLRPCQYRLITRVGTKRCRYIDYGQSAEEATKTLLGNHSGGVMSCVSSRFDLEYSFVQKVLTSPEEGPSHEGFCDSGDSTGQATAVKEGSRIAEDEAIASNIVDGTGRLRSSIDILSSAIHSHTTRLEAKFATKRLAWHIEFQYFWRNDYIHQFTWLTNRTRSTGPSNEGELTAQEVCNPRVIRKLKKAARWEAAAAGAERISTDDGAMDEEASDNDDPQSDDEEPIAGGGFTDAEINFLIDDIASRPPSWGYHPSGAGMSLQSRVENHAHCLKADCVAFRFEFTREDWLRTWWVFSNNPHYRWFGPLGGKNWFAGRGGRLWSL
ncbi:MAG: hypothetical protein LQ345_002238 [Seirophora villosa]|nr:MAG: hypothetical protein LQ345_002238 [Seirophora villosa]